MKYLARISIPEGICNDEKYYKVYKFRYYSIKSAEFLVIDSETSRSCIYSGNDLINNIFGFWCNDKSIIASSVINVVVLTPICVQLLSLVSEVRVNELSNSHSLLNILELQSCEYFFSCFRNNKFVNLLFTDFIYDPKYQHRIELEDSFIIQTQDYKIEYIISDMQKFKALLAKCSLYEG